MELNILNELKSIKELLKTENLLKKEFLTLEETSIYLGQSKSSIYKLTSKKEIPFYVPGGKKLYFRKNELDNWILNSRVEDIDSLESNVETYLSKPLKR